MKIQKPAMGQALLDNIGFLEWAKVPDDVLSELGVHVHECYISPDVHSLHIVWLDAKGEAEARHEVADYPHDDDDRYESVASFLSDEIGDDSWEVIDLHNDSLEDFINSEDFNSKGDYSAFNLDKAELLFKQYLKRNRGRV